MYESATKLRLAILCSVVATALLPGCESVVVAPAEVSDVQIVPASITLVEGESWRAAAVMRESGGAELPDRSVTWTVDDPEVAAVTADGVVEGRSPGSTVLRASSEGVTGTAEVTVLREPEVQCELVIIELCVID